MSPSSAEFRAYVADLHAYNNGILYGQWIDLDGLDATGIQQAVDAVIQSSPHPGAEEYAIHDWDGLPSSFGEWPDWSAVADYIEAVAQLDDPDREAFIAWLENIGEQVAPEKLDDFRDAYAGCFSSGEEFAIDLADQLDAIPASTPWPLSCIDWQAAWRELQIGGDYWSHRGSYGLHIYRNT